MIMGKELTENLLVLLVDQATAEIATKKQTQ